MQKDKGWEKERIEFNRNMTGMKKPTTPMHPPANCVDKNAGCPISIKKENLNICQ